MHSRWKECIDYGDVEHYRQRTEEGRRACGDVDASRRKCKARFQKRYYNTHYYTIIGECSHFVCGVSIFGFRRCQCDGAGHRRRSRAILAPGRGILEDGFDSPESLDDPNDSE